MPALKTLQHLFLPHESNNQKARILHTSSLIKLAVFLIFIQGLFIFIPRHFPLVLGYSANIRPEEVIRLTNKQRESNGLSALSENKNLDNAALAKGNDMLSKGYWAHFAPDGTAPWTFFTKFGYNYRFAGENLARDFSTSEGAVNAWMNSPAHKENILNKKYDEVGIGVVEGNLNGVDTTIIVQFFGSRQIRAPSIPDVKAGEIGSTSTEAIVSNPVNTQVLSPLTATKNISLAIIGILLMVLSIDLIMVKKARIARIGGRTLAHLAYFGMVLAVILILKSGEIL